MAGTMEDRAAAPVLPLRIPFTIRTPFGILPRFVYCYLVFSSEEIVLIDTGVAGSELQILDHLRNAGRDARELRTTILTHAHPDHIGAARAVREATGCTVAAHAADRPWIEDTVRQERERPVPGFSSLVGGPVPVGRVLADNDVIALGSRGSLTVIHTPGHSRGSISLLLRPDMVVFTGDAVPVPGGMPIYDDPLLSIQSLERLRHLEGVRTVYSSWDEPRTGHDVNGTLDRGIGWIRQVADAVERAGANGTCSDPQELTRQVFRLLGLPGDMVNPMAIRTVLSHVRSAGTG